MFAKWTREGDGYSRRVPGRRQPSATRIRQSSRSSGTKHHVLKGFDRACPIVFLFIFNKIDYATPGVKLKHSATFTYISSVENLPFRASIFALSCSFQPQNVRTEVSGVVGKI